MAAGLTSDAAFSRWKQGRRTEALQLYAEVLERLARIPTDEDLQARHVHALVRHTLAWIYSGEGDPSRTGLVEPPPGAHSNPEPHEGLKDHALTDMAVVWGLLGNIDTRFGTGLHLLRQAEQKSHTGLPLLLRLGGRYDAYEALWRGMDLPKAVSRVVGVIESSLGAKDLNAAQLDGRAPGDITPLAQNYWDDQNNRAYLLLTLVAVGVLATSLHPKSPLPLNEWLDDAHAHRVAGPDVDRFFALLSGNIRQVDGSLLENAAVALHRIREESLPPNDLFICHFRLLNALGSGEWGKLAGDALATIVATQWLHASENQRFALTNPSFYAPLLTEKCQDDSRTCYSKVACILQAAAGAAGVPLADSASEFLRDVERGGGSTLSSA